MKPKSTRLKRANILIAVGALSGVAGTVCMHESSVAHAQTVPSSARAAVRLCSELGSHRSLHSREPTRITFVNNTGSYRALNWIDYSGAQKSFGGLNSGQRRTVRTFRTHPWVSATGPGDCLQIILPAAEPSQVILK